MGKSKKVMAGIIKDRCKKGIGVGQRISSELKSIAILAE